eukprot:9110311-Pyramimonas_sp.AAC.1
MQVSVRTSGRCRFAPTVSLTPFLRNRLLLRSPRTGGSRSTRGRLAFIAPSTTKRGSTGGLQGVYRGSIGVLQGVYRGSRAGERQRALNRVNRLEVETTQFGMARVVVASGAVVRWFS